MSEPTDPEDLDFVPDMVAVEDGYTLESADKGDDDVSPLSVSVPSAEIDDLFAQMQREDKAKLTAKRAKVKTKKKAKDAPKKGGKAASSLSLPPGVSLGFSLGPDPVIKKKGKRQGEKGDRQSKKTNKDQSAAESSEKKTIGDAVSAAPDGVPPVDPFDAMVAGFKEDRKTTCLDLTRNSWDGYKRRNVSRQASIDLERHVEGGQGYIATQAFLSRAGDREADRDRKAGR
ncbi:hypothetical protein KIPB_005410 [Kipferlia bialata]|uniref:BCNT-C domain-containing protein n=1 Tax=Kipferlia bialata TaxID=797122 RepID=A0A9K3GI47_9EUKA|nr:hypothetical protein KIPB_005410 [Kipferlia bialata]|eukprot:g5410.t1